MEADLDEAGRNIDELRDDKASLESDLTADRETTAQLRQDKATLESNLVDANGEIDTLTSALAAADRRQDSAEETSPS